MKPLMDLAIGDVLDISPLHPHTFLMTPFLPSGFSDGGELYVNYESRRGTCRNCRGTGANFEYVPRNVLIALNEGFYTLEQVVEAVKEYGPCTYCEGSGHVSLPPPYSMTGRVLIPHEICTVWCGDIIIYTAGAYDEVEMNDGRQFAVMHDRAVLAIIERFEDRKINVPALPTKEVVLA